MVMDKILDQLSSGGAMSSMMNPVIFSKAFESLKTRMKQDQPLITLQGPKGSKYTKNIHEIHSGM